ncbi:MAG: cation diffusion facilitator family transporter [Pyrinomonadaceae bacterium]
MNRGEIHLPEEQQRQIDRARTLLWWSLGFMLSIIIVLAFVMGSSQAMKALWVEDTLSLVPIIASMLGIYFRAWQPDENFNYGYRRAVQVAFLAGAVALFGFGLYLFLDSTYKLIIAEHPSIQTIDLFGSRIWLGWVMIVALVYSIIPPFVLGRMKRTLANDLHDKSLYVSATIDKGDWLSGAAGVIGILGIAFGLWWTDALAAAFISFEIIKDGWEALKNSTLHLMDMRPTDVTDKEPDAVIEKVEHAVTSLPWVEHASIRLREEGDVIMGEAFVVPLDEDHLLEKLGDAGERVKSLDWRIQDFNIIPVSSLQPGGNNGSAPRR